MHAFIWDLVLRLLDKAVPEIWLVVLLALALAWVLWLHFRKSLPEFIKGLPKIMWSEKSRSIHIGVRLGSTMSDAEAWQRRGERDGRWPVLLDQIKDCLEQVERLGIAVPQDMDFAKTRLFFHAVGTRLRDGRLGDARAIAKQFD